MKRYFLLLMLPVLAIALFQGNRLNAQITTRRSANVRLDELMSRGTTIGTVFYDNVDGSPFLNDGFEPGEITMKNGMVFQNVDFRYNIYHDQIEFRQGEEILTFADPQGFEQVRFDDKTFVYRRYLKGKKPMEGYFQVLSDGHARLMIRREQIIKREKLPASDFGGGNYRDYFRLSVEYFITKDGKNLIPVRKTERSILKALNEKQSELKQFLSESNLNLKNDIDLGEVLFYYNQLMKGE